MVINKNKKLFIASLWGGALIGISVVIALPLFLIKNSKSIDQESFDLIEIKKQMKIAINKDADLFTAKEAIMKMYQNGTTRTLSFQTQASANALAEYVHNNKNSKDFIFKFGQVGEDKKLLLGIATRGVTSSLQNEEMGVQIYRQNAKSLATTPPIVAQPLWISNFLRDKDFGILFDIYQKRVVSQKSIDGTTKANLAIKNQDFKKDDPQDKIDTAQAKIEVGLPTQSGAKASYGMIPNATNVSPPSKVGVVFKFKSATAVDDNGTSRFTYEINVEPYVAGTIPKEVTFNVEGFQTKVDAIQTVQVSQFKINDAQAKNGVTTPIQRGQKVHYGMIPNATNVFPPIKAGVVFQFKIATKVNEAGISTFVYKIYADPHVDGTTSKEVTFYVDGFETKMEAIRRIVQVSQSKINDAKAGAVPPIKQNNVIHGATPQVEDASLPTKDDLAFTFKNATAVDDNGMSRFTYEVLGNPYVDGTTPRDVTFNVDGFETKVDAIQRIALDRAQSKIDDAQNTAIAPTKLHHVNNGATPQKDDVKPPEQSGLSFTWQNATIVDENGRSQLTYIVDGNPHVVGTIVGKVIFEVDNFETQVAAQLRIVQQNKINDAKAGAVPPIKQNNVNHGATPQKDDVSLPSKDGLSFQFQNATIVDDNGISKFTYEVVSDPYVDGIIPKIIEFDVGSFETKVEANKRTTQDKINDAQNGAIAPIKLDYVSHGATPQEDDVSPPSKDGLSFQFQNATIVDDNGMSRFTYEVDGYPHVDGTTVGIVTFEVGGFETKLDANKRIDSQTLINIVKTVATAPTKLNHVNNGAIPKDTDVNPPLKNGLSFKFQLATAVNEDGMSTFTYEVDGDPHIYGTTVGLVTFEVSGFETIEEVHHKNEVNEVQNKIDDAQAKKGVNFPIQRGEKVSYNMIPNATNVSPPTKDGVIFVFKEATRVNNEGISTLTYEVHANTWVAGTTPKEVAFDVVNFETQAEANQRKILRTTLSTRYGNKIWIPLLSHKKTFSLKDFGLTMKEVKKINDPSLNEAGVQIWIKYKYYDFINEFVRATLTIHVPNIVTKEFDIAIQGFKDPKTSLNDSTIVGDDEFKEFILPSHFQLLDSVKSIGARAFKGAILPTGFTIPSSVTKIGNEAFKGATLPIGFTIPSSVTSIGARAFEGVILPEDSQWFDNFFIDEDKPIDEPIIGSTLRLTDSIIPFGKYRNQKLLKDFQIPIGVTHIGVEAFYKATLPEGFQIPNSVTSIGARAFEGATLPKGFIITNSKISFGIYVFEEAILPKGFTIPKSITKIHNNIFQGATLPKGFTIPNWVTSIGDYAFERAILPEGFKIPGSVTHIGIGAFKEAILPGWVTIPSGITSMHSTTFEGVRLVDSSHIGILTHSFKWFDKNDKQIDKAIIGATARPPYLTIPYNKHKNEVLPKDWNIDDFIIRIGAYAFEGATLPKNFKIPSNVTHIGAYAFKGATLPEDFKIPSSVTHIGEGAFYKAILPKGFKLPISITHISDYTFYGVSLPEDFKLPSTITHIGNRAFKGAILPQGFNLPNGVTHIGLGAFIGVTLPLGFTIPNTVTYIGDEAFRSTKIFAGFKLPISITHISDYTFYGVSLPEDFRLPSTITHIGNRAFKGATLPQGFNLPNGVTHIGAGAFIGVTLPLGFTLPNTVTYIGVEAFRSTKIFAGFKLSDGITHISEGAFKWATLPQGFQLPSTITHIGAWAFYKAIATLAEEFRLPIGVTHIGDYAFIGVSLPLGFTIPNTVIHIGDEAFRDAKIPQGFNLPDGITHISEGAFKWATLPQGFQLPSTITHIGAWAFARATLPKDFKLPNGITLGENAFQYVKLPLWYRWFKNGVQLNGPTLGATIKLIPNINSITKILDNEFIDISFPKGFNIPNGVTHIHDNAFWGATLPQDFRLPSSIKHIGVYAFKGATLPQGFNLPNGVTHIGAGAFIGVTLPPGFTIPNTVTHIGDEAFRDAKIPQGFNLPDGITGISDGAFKGATLSEGFQLPSTITHIGVEAFHEATLPTRFTIPDGIILGTNAFQYVRLPLWHRWFKDGAQLNEPTLGATIKLIPNINSITKILDNEFIGITLSKDFQIPNGVTRIGVNAFWDTTLPKGFQLPSDVTHISAGAFWGATLSAGFTIPDGITLGTNAFQYVRLPLWHRWFKDGTQLNEPTLGATIQPIPNVNSITKILDNQFMGITLPKDFQIPIDVTHIGVEAFYKATLPEGFELPSTITHIGDRAFQGATLPEGFQLPNGVTHIGVGAFIEVTFSAGFRIPHTVTHIGDEAFRSTKIPKGFELPSGVTHISNKVFYKATLPKGFQLPSGVTHIGAGAFEGVTLPTGFQLPNTVTHIGARAFYDATLPARFQLLDGITLGKDAFLYVRLPLWHRWFKDGTQLTEPTLGATIKPIPSTKIIKKILDREFLGQTLPKGFQLPSTVTHIGSFAFVGATLPEGFQLPNGVTHIGAGAFARATLPPGFQLPSTIIRIGNNAFYETTLPAGFQLPSGVTHIGAGAFLGATLSKEFKLPHGLIDIGNSAFKGVTFFAGFMFPSSVTNVDSGAFLGATLPIGLKLPNRVIDFGFVDIFRGAKLPTGSKWFDKDGNPIDEPTTGATIKLTN